MKCNICNENFANIQYTQNINGIKTEVTICNECAKKIGFQNIDTELVFDFSNMMKDVVSIFNNSMLVPSVSKFEKEETKSFEDVFSEGMKNVFKTNNKKDNVKFEKELKIDELKNKLSEYIKLEQYEKAAEIRDEINKLK